MSDAPKVIYLQHGDGNSPDHRPPWNELNHDEVTWCAENVHGNDFGPYVDLDWFLAEVERMTSEKMRHAPLLEIIGARKWACNELAQQIKEGKIT